MNRLILLTSTLLLSTACAAMPWGDRREDPKQVQAGLLAYVPEGDRGDIHDAREQRSRTNEDLLVAKRDREQVESRLELARHDLDLIEQRVKEARTRVERARELGTAEELEMARKSLDEATGARRFSEAKIRYYEDLEGLAEDLVNLHEKRVELASARVELAEAEAVSRLDRPAAHEIDVHAFRERVARLEDAVAMEDVEARASRMRVELRREFLYDRAQAVPAAFRLTEPEPVESLLTLPPDDGEGRPWGVPSRRRDG